MQARRRRKSAAGDDTGLLKLTAEEEARLERLIATQASPDRNG
jgi:hypothetical protein